MSCTKELRFINITIIIIISTLHQVCINSVDSYPIEVTGKNINYYKLTPNEGSGSYNFDYGTKDGAQRSERGFVKHDPNRPEPLLVVTGSFKHPDANEVFYIADEQGYRIVSKEEIDELHSKLPNEIFPTTDNHFASSTVSPVKISPTFLPSRTPKTYVDSSKTTAQVPVTESKLIKVNIIQPVSVRPVTCAPGKCSGARQSKIFQIQPIKFGG